MCVVSMIIDDQTARWRDRYPQQWQWDPQQQQQLQDWLSTPTKPTVPAITQEEILEFRRLLEKAREYDKIHNQPHCESTDKKRLLKELAQALGVNVDFIEDF